MGLVSLSVIVVSGVGNVGCADGVCTLCALPLKSSYDHFVCTLH